MTLQYCTQCKVSKALKEFYCNGLSKTRHCRACGRERALQRRIAMNGVPRHVESIPVIDPPALTNLIRTVFDRYGMNGPVHILVKDGKPVNREVQQ